MDPVGGAGAENMILPEATSSRVWRSPMNWLHASMGEPERTEFADILFAYGSHAFEEAAAFQAVDFQPS